jgi:hypothetical protein
MGLAAFIRENVEAILNEWQEFAASVPSAKEMNRRELRNDAQEILLAIAADIDNSQSLKQQSQKSKGRQQRLDSSDTAAESHALARFASGFDIKEMVSEYRALRGSVVRLWVARAADADTGTLDELTRFNEGIDQALSESVVRFSDQVDESRQLYMGVLGHDLRTPLKSSRTRRRS